jgi:hypothetical protein
MKKGVAILMAAIMLLTGIQPVLSLHLCAGTLFSVSIFDEADNNPCCDEPMELTCHTTQEKNEFLKGSSSNINSYRNDCCEFQTIEISTDEFSRDAAQQTTHNLTQLTATTWAVIHSLLHPVIADNSLTIRQLFPPVGLSRITTDLLTFICICRI